MPTEPQVRSVALPKARLRHLARKLLDLAPSFKRAEPFQTPIKVVCISDTHNNQPELPPGDLLLHAGDLSEWGSFSEIQEQLSWISSQAHTHKVVIAGNHDVLFDQTFLDSNKERFPIQDGQSAADLDFGSVIYLQDSITTLDFAGLGRRCTIYGSPWTPKYVNSAFQYARTEDIWAKKVPEHLDILMTHGPPYGHLDGWRHSGCHYLAQIIEERQPRLVVFGHIHVGYGRELVKFNELRRLHEQIHRGWSGWEAIPVMLFLVTWAKVSAAFMSMLRLRRADRGTEMINAAVVGEDSRLSNEPVIAYI